MSSSLIISLGHLNTLEVEMNPEVREKMKKYWEQYEPSPESMMLCSAANDILAVEDRQQILEMSPTLEGKNVLELGAGIGRFTTELVKRANVNVTSVDFMESYIEKNRELNGHNPNVTFMAADVTQLELRKNSFDVIFTNWLLMYLSDEEIEQLVIKMLGWLTDGGYLFIRESCYRPSGNIKRATNPTYYRSPLDYFKILQNRVYQSENGHQFSFVCEKALSIGAYIKSARA